MNRHHPYDGPPRRRGGPPSGPGPDRSFNRFSDRGASRGRGRGGRGGFPPSQAPPPHMPLQAGPTHDYYASEPRFGGGYPNIQSPPTNAYQPGYETQQDPYYYQGNFSQAPNPYGGPNVPPPPPPPMSNRENGYGVGNPEFEDPHLSNLNSTPGGREEKPHSAIIEERIQRERPCRTLFIRNIKYETSSSHIQRMFDDHGEIKTFFDLISTRGMVFVTYYDLRDAERARERLQGHMLANRPIDVHFSLPRPEEIADRCDRDKNQGTLHIALRNSASNQSLDPGEVRRRFETYGDVKSVTMYNGRHDECLVEFYDSRVCVDGHDNMRREPFQDGFLEVDFAWDVPETPLPAGASPTPNPDRGFDEQRGGPPRGRGRGRGRSRAGRGGFDDRRGGFGPSRGGSFTDYSDNSDSYPRHNSPPVQPTASAQEGVRMDQARKLQNLLSALKQSPAPEAPPPASNPASYYASQGPPPPAPQPPYMSPPPVQPARPIQPGMATSSSAPNIMHTPQAPPQNSSPQFSPPPLLPSNSSPADLQTLMALLNAQRTQ